MFKCNIVAIPAIFTIITALIRLKIPRGPYGRDIHKPNKPKVREAGGIALLVGTIVAMILLYVNRFDQKLIYLGLSTATLGFIGLVDDFFPKGLRPKTKTLLTFLAGIFAIFANPVYLQTPRGKVSTYTLYVLIIPVGYAIFSNAMNMMDSVNSVSVLQTAIILSVQAFLLYMLKAYEAFLLALTFLVMVLVYLPFNMYPSHMFNGDVGDLLMGGMVFTVALYGNILIPTLIASIPIITNGILFIFSTGIKTRHDLAHHPTRLEERDGELVICPNYYEDAPKTLVRAIASINCCVSEKDLIKAYLAFFIISAILGLVVGWWYI